MPKAKKIMVVDDERPLREFVSRNLAVRGFQVLTAANGLEALALFHTEHLDLIIMDIMMPHMDGLEASRRIRQQSTVPIIALTALDEEADIVSAFETGVDDYLTKPFGVDELMARVRAVLRRVTWEASPGARAVLRHRDLEMDTEAMAVTCRGEKLHLTRTEFRLLHFFMQNVGKAMPHRILLQEVWGAEYGTEAEYLRVYIARLRRKIEVDPSAPEYLFTEYGIGYRFGA